MHVVLLSAIVALTGGQEGIGKRPAETPREAHMAHCLVSLIDEAQIPAEERGVLMELNVHEGASVMKGDLLAQIDDRDVQMARRVAELELAVSDEEARNDVEIRYARAAAAVAKAEWDEALQANRTSIVTSRPSTSWGRNSSGRRNPSTRSLSMRTIRTIGSPGLTHSPACR